MVGPGPAWPIDSTAHPIDDGSSKQTVRGEDGHEPAVAAAPLALADTQAEKGRRSARISKMKAKTYIVLLA